MDGYIHSVETFGAADGLGVRYILSLCRDAACAADIAITLTWDTNGGEKVSADEILRRAVRYKSYWKTLAELPFQAANLCCRLIFVTEAF